MQKINLQEKKHSIKVGDICNYKNPNVIEDSIFYFNEKPIGFYLKSLPDKAKKLADLANFELRSKNVPKSVMKRQIPDGKNEDGTFKYKNQVDQFSTIIGSVPPKPHMKRNYPIISSVHSVESAKKFIKAMVLLAIESEKIIHDLLPEQYNEQIRIFKNVSDKWKFGNLFTSSISNYNISAPFHRDTGNIPNTVNVIICKRLNSNGGDLHVPDYDATIGQIDNSILVYPAWRNVHGVTPIIPTFEGGYRNSLIFYPLKAFLNK
jgi:hypothetical protein